MLSDVERRLLKLVAQGLSTAEIAAQLGVQSAKVHRHLRIVIRRLGAQSKVHAIILAVRAGQITLAADPP